MSSLTSTVLRLHITLWKRSMSSNKSALFMNAMILFYGVASVIGILFIVGFGVLDSGPADYAPLMAGAVGAGVLGYAAVATMMPSGEGQLQPESFSVLPLNAKEIMPGLLLMQILQLRGLLALFATIATTIAFLILVPGGIVMYLWTILAMILSFGLVIVTAETMAMLISGNTGTDANTKDRKSLITVIAFAVAWIGFMVAFSMDQAEPTTSLRSIGEILQWTPFGAPGAMVGHAAAGQWNLAAIAAAITAVTLLVGAWYWHRTTERRLLAPLGRGGQKASSRAKGAGLLLPGARWSVGWAVYSRAIRYLTRDARLMANLIMLPVICVYFIFMGVRNDFDLNILIGIVVCAAMGTMAAVNDFGYDGPSNWVNIVSGARARTLLLARHWASITPGVIIFVIFLVLANAVFSNRLVLITSLLGIGGIIATTGINLLVSTFNPFPVARPGTSPWQDKSGFSSAAFLAAFAGLFLGWIPLLPAIVMVVVGSVTDLGFLVVLGVVVGIVIPLGFYLFAIRLATRRVETKYPEIFDKVKAWV